MAAACLVMAGAARLDALIFYASADVSFNTTAPTGDLADSGWQFQGLWGNFLGTPVAPSWFIAAKHVGGSVGQTFTLNGVNYTTVAKVEHPTADLILWQVSGTFPSYAPLYEATSEAGKSLVVFGRSGTRGSQVTVNKGSPRPLRGWLWGGAGAGTVRWGENRVEGTAVIDGANYLAATFDRNGVANEATFANGDSSGAVFIRDGLTWKLAGINFAVEADFATTSTGTSFRAALFDAGGLFYGANLANRFFVQDVAADVAPAWYATRISSYAAWILVTTGQGS